jgi:7-cyano-7-deazaguanine synthase in queuosine biosynthesis
MFGPIGALIGAGVGLAGSLISATGQSNALQAQSANAAYQAQVASNNAVIAGRNANMDLQAGVTAETNQGLKTRSQVGTALAGEGASGVNVNSGSFVKARAGISEIGAMGGLTIRSNTAKQLYADETQQTNYTAESGLLTQESGQASSAAPLAFTGSLLSGASSVGGSYFKYLQGGSPGVGAVSGL